MSIEQTELGELNHRRTSKGKNDECYTERYAVEPLLEFMEPYRNMIIWCPCDTAESEFVKVLQAEGFKVVYSHIDSGQDFYLYEPEKWDVLITNPPFTNKRQFFQRVLSFNKPFALIMALSWLDDKAPQELFKNKDLQLLMFTERMTFKNQVKGKKINYSCAYYCWNFLPKQIEIRDFKDRNQMKLLEG